MRASLGRLCIIGVVGLTALTLGGFAGRAWWGLELMSHFRVQLLLGSLIIATALVWLRRDRWAGLAAAMVLVNAVTLVPLYLPAAPPAGEVDRAHPLRVLLANVERRNRDFDAMARLIEAERPDLVGLVEPDQAWLDALEPALRALPHRELVPRPDDFGMALYSRHPLAGTRIATFEGRGPSIVAELLIDGRLLTVYLTHPFPPVGAEAAASRNAQLTALAEAVAAEPDNQPVVLLGDLNTTGWSPVFQDFIEASGLRDSRQGIGVQPSWGPVWSALPIDHVLHSPHIQTLDRRLGPDVGSDHRPVIVDLAW